MNLEDKLKDAGVSNLKEFGYPSVNSENIMTDKVFKAFFRSMLKDNLGVSKTYDEAINKLIAKIDEP